MRFLLFGYGLSAIFVLMLTEAAPVHAFPTDVEDRIRDSYGGSIYEIEAVARRQGRESGPRATGFKVSDLGHIITAFHLVRDFDIPVEDLDYSARLPGTDQRYRLTFDRRLEDADLLLLKMVQPRLSDAPPLRLARVGRFRAAEAFVFGLDGKRQLEGTVVRFTKLAPTRASFRVIDRSFNPGRSGSPVFDTRGRAIGLMHANTDTGRASFAPLQNAESALRDRGIVLEPEVGALPDWQKYLMIGVAFLIPLLMIVGYVISRRNRA